MFKIPLPAKKDIDELVRAVPGPLGFHQVGQTCRPKMKPIFAMPMVENGGTDAHTFRDADYRGPCAVIQEALLCGPQQYSPLAAGC
jgi:hypothetical protein